MNDYEMCPPEIVLDRPSEMNGWRWHWGVYQPDAHWASLIEGDCWDGQEAFKMAMEARSRVVQERNYGRMV